MVDYSFYTDTYMGQRLSQKEFSYLAPRAEDILRGWERRYRVVSPGADSRAMAVCAMAETIKDHSRHDGIQSATVGGVSVRYDSGSQRSLSRALYETACVYMDIYRGVG